jgi:uncharacterized protein (TIGR02266 family)
MPDFRERRKSRRTKALLRVEYSDPQDLLDDYITNLGEGGIFIRTALGFEPGQKLAFALSFPGLLEPIYLKGIVRWRRPASDDPYVQPGLGVEFIFADPGQKKAIEALFASLEKQEEAPEPTPAETRFRVLLVEDNAHALGLFDYAIRRYHSTLGPKSPLQVLTAENAKEALALLENQSVDLAIIDHFLPGMTGCELVDHLRHDPATKTTPMLVVSVGGEEVRKMAYQSGADLFLDKPVLHRQLIHTITSLLGRAGG